MGRTLLTYRTVLEALIHDWQGFRNLRTYPLAGIPLGLTS